MDEELKKLLMQLMEGQEEIKIEVRKNSLTIESMQEDLKQISEIQENQCEVNERNHIEIIEMLTERLDIQDKAIKNITVIK